MKQKIIGGLCQADIGNSFAAVVVEPRFRIDIHVARKLFASCSWADLTHLKLDWEKSIRNAFEFRILTVCWYLQMIKNHPEWEIYIGDAARRRTRTRGKDSEDMAEEEWSWSRMGIVEVTAVVMVGLGLMLLQMSPGMQ